MSRKHLNFHFIYLNTKKRHHHFLDFEIQILLWAGFFVTINAKNLLIYRIIS